MRRWRDIIGAAQRAGVGRVPAPGRPRPQALARIRRQRPDDLRLIGEWPAIIGFRNVLAHAYEHIEDAVVWGIVTEQLPRFIEQLEAIPGLDQLSGQ